MNQNQKTDLETIQQVLKGEHEQFSKLIERHQSALFYFILKIVKDHDDAEEIAQESFIKAFHQLDKFDHTFVFKTWLFTIARNLAFNFLKKQPKGIFSINQKVSDESEIHLEIPDRSESAFERQAGLQFEEAVKKAIANLGPKYAAVFHLKHFEQMEIKQIATTMNLTVSNVKVLLHRARNQIKEQLGDWVE